MENDFNVILPDGIGLRIENEGEGTGSSWAE